MILDARTREGVEAEIVRQVRDHGGFSVFWITANRKRAAAADRLVERGTLLPVEPQSPFPWCSWRLASARRELQSISPSGRKLPVRRA